MRLLDAYCCQGGAGKGYADAGFEVVGVDHVGQPRYPFRFIKADAIEYIRQYGHLFDCIHASPPCQLDSLTRRINGRDHPDLIEETREALEATGKPYVIENVEGARPKLRDPVMLCGTMFGLRTYRHRLFETNWPLTAPPHPQHVAPQVKMGRAPKPGEWVQAVGNFSGVQEAREAMGMPWVNRDGLREAIPPAYAEWIGRQMLAFIQKGSSMLCAWCEREAVRKIEVQPAKYKPVVQTDPQTGEKHRAKVLEQRAIQVPACGRHQFIKQLQPDKAPSMRAKAKDVEQTTIFDMLDEGPRHAIDDAA